MITKYQKKVNKEIDGENVEVFEECTEEEATHILYSYHDEANFRGESRPCRRVTK